MPAFFLGSVADDGRFHGVLHRFNRGPYSRRYCHSLTMPVLIGLGVLSSVYWNVTEAQGEGDLRFLLRFGTVLSDRGVATYSLAIPKRPLHDWIPSPMGRLLVCARKGARVI